MNISGSTNLSLINNSGLEGTAARQEYGVAVAVKINEQIKQEGEAAVKLIESAPGGGGDGSKGRNLNAYA
jgi:hypothetical protein